MSAHDKEPNYYANNRTDLTAFLPPGPCRILEIGCGTGQTGAALKRERGPGTFVAGVELYPDAAATAEKVLDRVFAGDVEKIPLPFEEGSFDAVIYGDVLEHLIDPWGLVQKHARLLKPGGMALASIPNIAHYRIVRMLRRKEWQYTKSGIMDITHLRFFTIRSIRELFGRAGLSITHVGRITSATKVRRLWNALSGGALIDDITEQYLIAAVKDAASGAEREGRAV